MADIAFLLLTFFLVATSLEKSEGIRRDLAKKDEKESPQIVQENDVLKFEINAQNQIFLRNQPIKVSQLSDKIKEHVDNGGGRVGLDNSGEACTYCKGKKSPQLSDHPKDALLVFSYAPEATYEVYISIQEQIDKAFKDLRNRYAMEKYGLSYDEAIKTNQTELVRDIEARYPKNIVEPTPQKSMQ